MKIVDLSAIFTLYMLLANVIVSAMSGVRTQLVAKFTVEIAEDTVTPVEQSVDGSIAYVHASKIGKSHDRWPINMPNVVVSGTIAHATQRMTSPSCSRVVSHCYA